jgi:hypothetical protein
MPAPPPFALNRPHLASLGKLLHIGEIDLAGAGGICHLTLNYLNSRKRTVVFDSANRGIMVELEPTAAVGVNFDCPTSGTNGWLCWGNGTSEFPAEDGEAFFARAFVCPNATSIPTASKSAVPTLFFTATARRASSQSSQSRTVTETVPPSSGHGGVEPWLIGVVAAIVIIVGVAVGAVLRRLCLETANDGQDRAQQELITDASL